MGWPLTNLEFGTLNSRFLWRALVRALQLQAARWVHCLLCSLFLIPSLQCLHNPCLTSSSIRAPSNPFLHIINDYLLGFETCCLSLHCLWSTHSPPPLPVPSYHMSFCTYSTPFGLNSTNLALCVHITIGHHTIWTHSSLWMNCLNPMSWLSLTQQRVSVMTTLCHGCGPTCPFGISWHGRRLVLVLSNQTWKSCSWSMISFKLRTSIFRTCCHLTLPGTPLSWMLPRSWSLQKIYLALTSGNVQQSKFPYLQGKKRRRVMDRLSWWMVSSTDQSLMSCGQCSWRPHPRVFISCPSRRSRNHLLPVANNVSMTNCTSLMHKTKSKMISWSREEMMAAS